MGNQQPLILMAACSLLCFAISAGIVWKQKTARTCHRHQPWAGRLAMTMAVIQALLGMATTLWAVAMGFGSQQLFR